jgi:inosine-uridine nucleoside N-ribohydrolase
MAGAAMDNPRVTKVLLDTDIGTNLDDALCLAYLLAQASCRLMAVTTVTGQAEQRARLARVICRAAAAAAAVPAGAQHGSAMPASAVTPVMAGAERPLLVPLQQVDAPQADLLLTGPGGRVAGQPRDAVDLMRRVVHSHPGEIELLAIGPLTNVALLFACDAQVPGLLRGLTLMCGSFSRGEPGPESPERNARSDPHAAAIVYGARVRRCRSIGLNVTRRVRASAAEVREMLSHGPFEPVRTLAHNWFRDEGRAGAVLNDPLAAAALFSSDVCRFERGTVEVQLDATRHAGATVWRPGGPEAPHEVAMDADPDACLRHLRATFAVA